MKEQLPEVFIDEKKIEERISSLAEQINKDYGDKEVVVICVLKGAFVFCADLIQKMKLPVRLEFMQVSSYGNAKTSSGECKLQLDVTGSVEDKHVLIVEDIVDTGLTIDYLMKLMSTRNPRSLKLASLLYKPANTTHKVHIDYMGFEIEDKFVVGYGLDYAGRYRELPYVGILNAGN